MRRKVGLVVVVAVVALIAAWWLRGHHRTSGSTTQQATTTSSGSTADHGHRAPQAPATLSGKVTHAGAPIAGATVAIARAELGAEILPSQAPTLVVTTTAAGTWTSPVAPGTYIIAATAHGLLPGTLPKLVVGAGEQRVGLDIALEAGGTIVHGTVSDVGGGPIAGARVTMRTGEDFSLSGHADFVAMTAQDGRYELAALDGEYRIDASHDEYVRSSERITVKGKPVKQDFTLVPGGTIKGKVVVRASGKPVPAAWIDVRGKRQSSWGVGEGVTDDDGNFTLHSLQSGAISLTATGAGFASSSPTVVELGVGEQVEGITILVDRAFTIAGKVVDKRQPENGIPGILVGGFALASQQVALAHEPTDKEGRFEIVGVRPAGYTIAAFGEGKVPDIGKSIEVIDKDIKDVVIELENGVTLSGRVEPPGKASIALTIDGEIGLANMFQMAKLVMVRATSDATTGAFKLEHVPAGKLVITADTDDGAAGKMPLTVAETDQGNLVVTLETRASISGTVTDTSGAPAVGAHVYAYSTDHKQSISFDRRPDVEVAADGTFRIVGLEPGKYTVNAGWGWEDMGMLARDDKKQPSTIDLAKAEQKTGLHLTVEARDGVIRGTVVGADGHPAGDAWVTAHVDRGKEGASYEYGGEKPVLTSAEGKFTIDHLRHGTYALIVDGPRGASRGEKTGVKTGDTVTIELTTLGTLTGHATKGGAPVAVYDLSCKGPVSIDRRITAADGSYTLEHLAPGSYACNVTADQGTANGTVDVSAGPATLDLALRPWASVVGTVASVLSGQPVSGITVIAGGLQDGRGFADVLAGKAPTTDAAGHFRVEHVAAGSGSITLMPATGGFESLAKKEFTAGEGQLVDVGTIKVVPPRNGDAGTFGLVTGEKDGKLAVVSISPGGPAEQAGITTADVITALDGHAIRDIGAEPAAALLSSGRIGVGTTIALTLERGTTVTLTAAKW